MQKPYTVPYTKDDILTYQKMAEKYDLDPEQTYALIARMYKRNTQITVTSVTDIGNNKVSCAKKCIPVIMPLRTSHTSKNDPTRKKQYLVHPMAHDYFLTEYFKLYPNEKHAPQSTDNAADKSVADKISDGKKRLIDTTNPQTIAQIIETENTKGK